MKPVLRSISARVEWRPATAFFIVLWAGLLWAGRERMLRDPGTLWHTVVGQQILQTGRLPQTDSFSFTQQGQEWIAQQWLGDCAMAIVHRIAGLDGLLLATATLLAGLFAWLVVRFRRAGLLWPAATLLLMLVIAASSYHFMPRPHLVTILLLAGNMALLCDVEAGRVPPKRLLALPVVFILWTNIHGGVLGGVATTSIVLFAWILKLRRPATLGKSGRPVLIAATLCLSFIAILINPYGPALPRTWLSLMNSDLLPKLIIEHAPLNVASTEGIMILLLATVYLALLACVWRSGLRIVWLVPLIWFALTLTRVRHGPLFAVTAAVAIADMLSAGKRQMVDRGFGTWYAHKPPPSSIGFRHSVIPVALVLFAFVLQATGIHCPIIGAGWARLNPHYWPIEATEALCQATTSQGRQSLLMASTLTEHSLRAIPQSALEKFHSQTCGTGVSPVVHHRPEACATRGFGSGPKPQTTIRIFNDMLFGGYLIYRLPQARIYIDDRCELYRDAGLRRYVELQRHPERFAGLAACDDIRLAMVHTHSPLDDYLAHSPAWTTVHRDATASVYYRNPSQ